MTPYHPLPHQEIIADWYRTRPRAGILVGMGLGKTASTLAHLSDLFASGKATGVVIVSPLRVSRLTWPVQIEEWDTSAWMRHVNLNTPEGEQAWNEGSAEIYLTHFHTLPSKTVNRKCPHCKMTGCAKCNGGMVSRDYPGIVERLMKRKSIPANVLVVDESSCLKDPNGKWGKFLRQAIHHFDYRYILTGTPISNGYEDLFAQIRLLDDGERLGRSFHMYRQTYFRKPFQASFTWEIRPGAKEKIDAKIADICLSLSSEDWLKVPETVVNDIEITLPPAARKLYDKMQRDLLLEFSNGDVTAVNAAVKVGKLLQITSGSVYRDDGVSELIHTAKIDALLKLKKSLGDEPLLVMIGYDHERQHLLAQIPEAVEFREEDMPLWQAGRIPYWVCHPAQMSHGIDGIQVAGKHVVWLTPTHSSETYHQTNARVVRQGQQHVTTIHRILVENSIDWAVVSAVEEKTGTQRNLLTALKNLQRLSKV